MLRQRRKRELNFSPTNQEYLTFKWENRKYRLENQMVRPIPFGKLQKTWTVIFEMWESQL